jgi:O-antigen/teichoic acid export membrane protein
MSAQPETPNSRSRRGPTTAGLSLGQLAIRGGGYLIGREAIGMVVRLVGVVVVVRLVGPDQFGLYSAAAAFSLFAAAFAQMGLEVYLIRLGANLRARHFNQAFSLLLVASVVVTAVGEGLTFAMGGLLRPVGVLAPLRVLLLCTPINVLWAPAQAAIERRFDYRAMGLIELGGDIVLYATAIPLALQHHGAWSLVFGFFAWQSWLLVASILASGLRPRWDWSWTEVRAFCRHGLGFSSSDWLRRAGSLVNPLVVGTFFGATGVGYVAFALRLVDTVGFAKRSAYRLGLVAMSRVNHDDSTRLRYSIEEGSLLQFLALAVPFACFGVVARWVVPVAFGNSWMHALPVYSLLALAAALGSGGFVQSTFLYSRGRNVTVAVSVALRDVALAASAVPLVRTLGLDGFGVATLVGLVALVYLHVVIRRVFPFSYTKVLPWAAILGPPILFPMVPMPWALLLLSPAVLVALPSVRREIGRLFSLLRSARSPRAVPAGGRVVAAPAVAPSPEPGSPGAGCQLTELAPAVWSAPGPLDAAFGPDELTGLPTLSPFVSELATALAGLCPGHGTLGVMLVELVPRADPSRPMIAELKAVAARLSDRLRERDLVARVGPSLFAVLVRLPYEVDLEVVRHRTERELEAAIGVSREGPTLRVGLSVVTGASPIGAEQLLRSALVGLSGAERAGGATAPHRPWQLAFVGTQPAGSVAGHGRRVVARRSDEWQTSGPSGRGGVR